MLRVHVYLRATGEPLKRVPLVIYYDGEDEPVTALTDRGGVVELDIPPGGGKILINGVAHYQGSLTGEVEIPLWSMLEGGGSEEAGAPGGGGGTTAYPGMATRSLEVDGREILTDGEGYLVDMNDWSEAFVRAEAAVEGLALTNEHWQVIRFLRDYYDRHGVQAQVRKIIQHFREQWGTERGNNHYLHQLFPAGGPQKQGNRLAGLLRTKGEH